MSNTINTTNIPYIAALITVIHSEMVLNKEKPTMAGRNAHMQLKMIVGYVMTAGCMPKDKSDLMMYNCALRHYIEYLIHATHHLCKIDTVTVSTFLASVAADVAEELKVDISQTLTDLREEWGDEEDCDNPNHDAECSKEYDDF